MGSCRSGWDKGSVRGKVVTHGTQLQVPIPGDMTHGKTEFYLTIHPTPDTTLTQHQQ